MFFSLLVRLALMAGQPQDEIFLIVHCESDFPGAARVAQEITLLAEGRKDVYVLLSEESEWRSRTEIPGLLAGRPSIRIAPGGQHTIRANGRRLVITGGYFRACFANAVRCILADSWPTQVVIPMKAVYFGAKRTLYEQYRANWRNRPEPEFIAYIREALKLDEADIRVVDTEIHITKGRNK